MAPLKCADRTEFKMAEKAGLRSQVFSKWKPEPRGIEEEAVTRSGTWSDAKRVREEREVFGKRASQASFTKQRSKRTRVGQACLLLQV